MPFYFYDEYMKANDLYTAVEDMMAVEGFDTDFDIQEDELKILRKAIKKGTTPDWIITALEEMHAAFPEGQSLRYRSSTNNEDLPGFNGAGLYDSKTQDPDETEEDGIDKSIKGVWESLWNFRAFVERDFHRVDHLTTAMGVLVHPNYSDELANGVAVSYDIINDRDGFYYVNTQVGEDLVTNPDALSVPEEILVRPQGSFSVLAISNQAPPGQLLMSPAQTTQLSEHLTVIHDHFEMLYNPVSGEPFAMEIEFKITVDNILAIKQARPWVFNDASTTQLAATGAPAIIGTVQVGETLTADTTGIADANGLSGATFSYQWISNDGNADTDIVSATDSTYTLVADDEGKTIKVRVSFTDDASNGKTLTSAATAAVEPETGLNTPATGAPAITGTAQVGETLTADTSGIADADGLANVSYSYQWVANDGTSDTDIAGATDSTYILVASDEGKAIKVRVSFTDDAGYAETLTSAPTAAVEARPNSPAIGSPTIGGTAQLDETLTADTSGISDADGLTNATFSYQWVANDGTTDTDITGATASTYILVASEEGKTVKVRVSFTDDAGHGETLTSVATVAVAAAEPQEPPALPQGLTGTVDHDAVTLTWDDPDDGSITGYQILRRDRAIHAAGDFQVHVEDTGSAAASYVDQEVSPESSYVYRIKARNGTGLSGSSSYFRADTPVAPNSPATGAPTIGGTAQVGGTLTADTSGIADADGLVNVSYSYQWVSNDGTLDTDIAGATDSTYILVASDEGKAIKVRVSFTDDAASEESLTSDATAAVEDTLTAEFHRVPNSHNGTDDFTFRILFSEPIAMSYRTFRDHSLEVAGGSVTQAHRVNGRADLWVVKVVPDSDSDVILVLPAGRTCDMQGAVCTGDGKILSNQPEATVPGPSPANSSATGVPTISGAAQVGETLAADATGIADADGLTNVTFSYQWIASDGTTDTDIPGATDSTYTLTANDEGKTIKVRVTFTDDAANNETLTSGATAAVAARPNRPATGAPAISGTAQVGETMTAETSGIADDDGLANETFSYQWLAGGLYIQGATGSTYILVADDEGRTITVRVSFTDDAGNEETLTSTATAAVAAAEQEPQEPPALPQGLTGTVAHDAVSLTWDDPGDASITGYQILRRDKALHAVGQFMVHVEDTGSAATSYVDRDVEPETRYVYRIKAINGAGLSERSDYFGANTPPEPEPEPEPNNPATGEPAISGTARVGETLTADTSGIADADGLSGATFSYQWVAADGTADTDIPNATVSTYTLGTSDDGKTIKVRVTFTDDGGNEETLTSAATEAVTANDQETTSPSLTGVVVYDANLILIYREDLDEDSTPAASAFAVTVGGSQWAVVGVWVSGSVVWLTLDAAVTAADTVLVSYTAPPDAAPRIQDTEGNAAGFFNSEPVENMT